MKSSAFYDFISLGKLTVLLFHKVPCASDILDPDELGLSGFEKVLASVQEIFRVLPLEDAMQALKKGNLPPRSACITLDDGYADWMDGVVPVIKILIFASFF